MKLNPVSKPESHEGKNFWMGIGLVAFLVSILILSGAPVVYASCSNGDYYVRGIANNGNTAYGTQSNLDTTSPSIYSSSEVAEFPLIEMTSNQWIAIGWDKGLQYDGVQTGSQDYWYWDKLIGNSYYYSDISNNLGIYPSSGTTYNYFVNYSYTSNGNYFFRLQITNHVTINGVQGAAQNGESWAESESHNTCNSLPGHFSSLQTVSSAGGSWASWSNLQMILDPSTGNPYSYTAIGNTEFYTSGQGS